MSTLNVSNIINAWVENELHLTATIYNDVIPDNANDAICLRYDPAPAAERRYQDGTRLLKWNLAYYVRNKKRENAFKLAGDITAKLDGAEITDATSGLTVQVRGADAPAIYRRKTKKTTQYIAPRL